MKQYLGLFKIKFINNLQYRVAAIAGIATQFFFGFVFIMVYVAFYESSSNPSLPMELSELVSYLWLNQAFFALVYMWTKDKELLSMIRNGNIAYELCRPVKFYVKWYVTIYASKVSDVLLRFAPVLLVAYFLPEPYNLSMPESLISLILFAISLLLSSFLVVAISMIFHIITFFTLNEKGVLTIFMSISEILAGGTIPLAFFPDWLAKIAYVLPFRYVCDLPFRIYSGNIGVSSAIPDIIGSLFWTIVCITIGYLLTKKALKKAVIQGG